MTFTVDKESSVDFLTFASPSLTAAVSTTLPSDAGTHSISATVCDEWNACTTQSFKVTINQVPTVDQGMGDQTCTQYHACSFSLPPDVFEDLDVETLTMSVDTVPASGALTGASDPLSFTDPDFVTTNFHYTTAGTFTY